MADDGSTSPHGSPAQPPHNPIHPALPSKSSFLALSEDVSLSTRGQRLPSLLQNRIGSIKNTPPRRFSTRPNDSLASGNNADLERGITQQRGEYESSLRQPQQHTLRISGDGRGIDMDYGFEDVPDPPPDFPLAKPRSLSGDRPERKASALLTPQMRSQRLIGNSNPRYMW